MNNWKLLPSHPVLQTFIECYWFLEKTAEDHSVDSPILNPDTYAHLILADPVQTYDYTFEDKNWCGTGCHLILPHSHSLTLDHSSAFVIIGVKFKAGALYALGLNEGIPDINAVVDYPGCLEGTSVLNRNLLNMLTESKSAPVDSQEIGVQLDAWLLPWLQQVAPDKYYKLASAALTHIRAAPISGLGETLQCSQRSVERAFVRVTGFTMKQYQSIQRLDAMLEQLYQQTDQALDWSDIAAQHGFSDQPHLSRYIKAAIGKTPGAYARQRDLTIDVYGDFNEKT